MRCGFAYTTPYTLTPVLPLTGWTTFLRHPFAYLLLVRFARSAQQTRRSAEFQALSIARFDMGAPSRVREYQPVVHRLRLSASP
jgi:hypothetical protein